MSVQELTALLLPVAAASGWYAARRHYLHQYRTNFSHPLTQAYRRGLNYLLDEKTDKAIAALAEILEQDAERMETHITLGNLFRRRGEVEKAIEIHAKLLQEPGLTPIQRARASHELGIDYMRSGLLDRAESIFTELARSGSHGKVALQRLLQIYQQQRDWPRAIACVTDLRRQSKPRFGETVAHFLCELAEEAMAEHRLKDARDYLSRALEDDPGSVRASIAKGRLELGNGEHLKALQTLKDIERQDPAYLSVVLPLISLCADRLGQGRELLDYYGQLYADYGIVSAAVARAERLQHVEGIMAAVDYLLPILEAHPEPLAVARALALLAADSQHGSGKLRRLSALLNDIMADTQQFQCEQCGFDASELYWRCPSCQYWGSIRPVGPFAALSVTTLEQDVSREGSG